jgi:hypothetical protein
MKPFQRSSLDIQLDDVLDAGAPLPHLFSGHTPGGQRYLIIQMSGDEQTGTWVCAPITERAMHYVLVGLAQLRDAVAHSATGAVDIVTVTSDGHCFESSRLCRELTDDELPPLGARLRPQDEGVGHWVLQRVSGRGERRLTSLEEGRLSGPIDQSRLVAPALASVG